MNKVAVALSNAAMQAVGWIVRPAPCEYEQDGATKGSFVRITLSRTKDYENLGSFRRIDLLAEPSDFPIRSAWRLEAPKMYKIQKSLIWWQMLATFWVPIRY